MEIGVHLGVGGEVILLSFLPLQKQKKEKEDEI